jgi:peptidoglycan/LPS O-acetylase OafA/YrhL
MFIIIFLFFLSKVFSFTFIHLLKTQTFIIEYNLVLKSFFAFNVGCLIYCLSKKIKENKSKFNRFAYLIINIFLIMILDKFFSEAIPNGSIPVIILFFAIYFDFAFKKMNFLLNYLGNISYSIYLIHFPVQLILIIVNYNFILLNFETISVFWIYIFLTIALGSLSYYFFETPIKRKLLNKIPTFPILKESSFLGIDKLIQ